MLPVSLHQADHRKDCLQEGFGDLRKVCAYSRFYRANLFFEDGRLYFRDIHKNDDGYGERYYDTVCTTNPAIYDTLPVCDGWNLAGGGADGRISLGDGFSSLAVVKKDEKTLAVYADGRSPVEVTFGENAIRIVGARLSFSAKDEFLSEMRISDGGITMKHRGFSYSVGIGGRITETHDGYSIMPEKDGVELFFDR